MQGWLRGALKTCCRGRAREVQPDKSQTDWLWCVQSIYICIRIESILQMLKGNVKPFVEGNLKLTKMFADWRVKPETHNHKMQNDTYCTTHQRVYIHILLRDLRWCPRPCRISTRSSKIDIKASLELIGHTLKQVLTVRAWLTGLIPPQPNTKIPYCWLGPRDQVDWYHISHCTKKHQSGTEISCSQSSALRTCKFPFSLSYDLSSTTDINLFLSIAFEDCDKPRTTAFLHSGPASIALMNPWSCMNWSDEADDLKSQGFASHARSQPRCNRESPLILRSALGKRQWTCKNFNKSRWSNFTGQNALWYARLTHLARVGYWRNLKVERGQQATEPITYY
jgi:hypothetical protein